MQIDSRDPVRSDDERPRFQFSLRAQMIVVTALAVIFGLCAIIGWPFALILFHGILYLALPTPLTIGALFGRGELRVFCIGALVPWVATWGQGMPLFIIQNSTRMSSANVAEYIIVAVVFILAGSAVCGVLAVATHRWLLRRHNDN